MKKLASFSSFSPTKTNSPSAIEDARKWSRACSTAANAIADALASGKRPPTKQELVDLVQEREAKNNKGSNFTIGAPLTLVALAGRSIHRGRVDASYSASVPTCPAENSISLVTARHRWFDSAIMEALAGEGCGVEVVISPSATSDASKNDKGSGSSSVRVEIRPRRRRGEKGEEEITQVVLLGAGMDARAWRLPLPAGNGVSWFDLDSGPVCEIKRRELESAGAELLRREEEGEGKGREEASTSPPAIPPPPRFPLKPRSYSLVGCDMASAGEWVAKLKGAGFDPERPAVFAAEGLIYYLGAKAPDFMRALQSIAAPGSVFLLDALDEQGVASAVKKAEGKGLQGQFSFGVPDADSGSELADFFASFGFDRVVSADTWSVLRARFQREAYPLRCFTKDKPSCGKAEGGIRFLVVAKGV